MHFDDINQMNLTGVTHVEVMENGGVHHHNKDGTEKSKMHLHIEDEKSKKHSYTENLREFHLLEIRKFQLLENLKSIHILKNLKSFHILKI